MSKQTAPKSERKTLILFLLMMAACAVIGFLVGMGAGTLSDSEAARQVLQQIADWLCRLALPVYALLNAAGIALAVFHLRRARKSATQLADDNEDALDAVEQELGRPVVITTVVMICNYFLFIALMYIAWFTPYGEGLGVWYMVADLVLFLGALTAITAIQKKAVDLEKQLNPEKRGNILDPKFSKQWEASCDEAQQHMIYQSGYHAYRAGNTACCVLWLLTVLTCLFGGTGLMPCFCVVAVWMTLALAYLYKANQLEHGKGKTRE